MAYVLKRFQLDLPEDVAMTSVDAWFSDLLALKDS